MTNNVDETINNLSYLISGDCTEHASDFVEEIKEGIKALKELKLIKEDIENFSDGYHTFNDLYYQRAVLFSVLVNSNKSKCWKTHRHENGELCFGKEGWFLVTIETPEGNYGYHFEDKYWDLFKCDEIERAKHWDGYTEKDVTRLNSLIKHKESTALEFCTCGSRQKARMWWNTNTKLHFFKCDGCGLKAEGAKTEIQARRNWNNLILNKRNNEQEEESESTTR